MKARGVKLVPKHDSVPTIMLSPAPDGRSRYNKATNLINVKGDFRPWSHGAALAGRSCALSLKPPVKATRSAVVPTLRAGRGPNSSSGPVWSSTTLLVSGSTPMDGSWPELLLHSPALVMTEDLCKPTERQSFCGLTLSSSRAILSPDGRCRSPVWTHHDACDTACSTEQSWALRPDAARYGRAGTPARPLTGVASDLGSAAVDPRAMAELTTKVVTYVARVRGGCGLGHRRSLDRDLDLASTFRDRRLDWAAARIARPIQRLRR